LKIGELVEIAALHVGQNRSLRSLDAANVHRLLRSSLDVATRLAGVKNQAVVRAWMNFWTEEGIANGVGTRPIKKWMFTILIGGRQAPLLPARRHQLHVHQAGRLM